MNDERNTAELAQIKVQELTSKEGLEKLTAAISMAKDIADRLNQKRYVKANRLNEPFTL